MSKRKRREIGKSVKYKCQECRIEEDIPKGVVEMFDALDDEGDISVPPRFECEKCGGLMEPVKYIGVHGITYEFKG